MQIVIDISKDRYDEIMSMDWKNCRRFFDEELRAIHDGKALEQKPSSSEKPNKWIPVSERLPELNRPLLVTTYHRVYYGHMISESGNYGYPVFRIHGLGDKNRDWVQETISHEPYSLGRIDAWMYIDIPEPYKQEVEGCR